jgi:hypothetical protein
MIWVSLVSETEISLALLPHFRIQVPWNCYILTSSLHGKDFAFDQLSEVLFLTLNSSEFEYRVQGDNICRDHEGLGMGGRVPGRPMCEGTGVFE